MPWCISGAISCRAVWIGVWYAMYSRIDRTQTEDELLIRAHPTSRCIRWCTWLKILEMESGRVARHIALWLASRAGVASIRGRSVPKAASECHAHSDYWPDRNKSRLWRSGHLLWISNLRKADEMGERETNRSHCTPTFSVASVATVMTIAYIKHQWKRINS